MSKKEYIDFKKEFKDFAKELENSKPLFDDDKITFNDLDDILLNSNKSNDSIDNIITNDKITEDIITNDKITDDILEDLEDLTNYPKISIETDNFNIDLVIKKDYSKINNSLIKEELASDLKELIEEFSKTNEFDDIVHYYSKD